MKNSWLILLCLFSFNFFGQAKEDSDQSSEEESAFEIRIKTSYVQKFGLGKSSSSLDPFFQFSDQANSFSFLTYSIYFKEKWGVQVSFSADRNPNLRNYGDDIYNRVFEEFGEQYFLNPYNPKGYNSGEEDGFGTVLLGIGRRINYKKWIIRPTLSAGIARVQLRDTYYKLKRKEKNEYRTYQIEAFPNTLFKEAKSFWMLTPSIEFDYKIYKTIHLSTQISSNFTFLDHTFYESILDENMELIESKNLDYKRVSSSLGLGLGFCLSYKI